MAPPLITKTITGNARNNSLYGTSARESIDGGLGDDYLRGYGGDDYLKGGLGADRFVFERTWVQNGTDIIEDYNYAQNDVLDLSLVGFARGVFNRGPLDDVIRIMPGDDDGDPARLLIDVNGGGNSFDTWALLEGLGQGDIVKIRVGAKLYDVPVAAPAQPQITAFTVSEVNELSVTADSATPAALYAWDTEGGGVGAIITGTAVSLSANTPGFITVSAQANLTEAVLRLADGGAPTPDTHVFLGVAGDDSVWGSDAADMIFGFGGNDGIRSGGGADSVQGGVGNDSIYGEAGDDELHGDADNDGLYGGAGADTLYGDTGHDWLDGGEGVDTLYGGEGNDVFYFEADDLDTTAGLVTDIIGDFDANDDYIFGAFGEGSDANYTRATATVATLADLLDDANNALDGTIKYYLGQVTDGSAYLVTDDDGNGYTEVIALVGVALNDITWASIHQFH